MAIGGSAAESIILTGSNSQVIVLRGNDAEAFKDTLQHANPATISSQPPPRTTFQQLPEVSRFGLNHVVETCLEKLWNKHGLIGLTVPCSERAFLDNFCDRLKYELERGKTQLCQTLFLKPQVTSVNRAVERSRIIKTSGKSGFVPAIAKWVMERCKILVKNFERTLANATTKINLCFIRLMIKRLAASP